MKHDFDRLRCPVLWQIL